MISVADVKIGGVDFDELQVAGAHRDRPWALLHMATAIFYPTGLQKPGF
jgi:hypothetical protein